MKFFLSTVTNKVDKKGRVSVPAKFRAVVSPQEFPGVICYRSLTFPCADGSTESYFERLTDSIDEYNPYADEYSAFAVSILADCHQLSFDQDGRITLPEELIEHANLREEVTFAGLGKTFQMWEPGAFSQFQTEKREQARLNAPNLANPARLARLRGSSEGGGEEA